MDRYPKARAVFNCRRAAAMCGYVEASRPFLAQEERGPGRGGKPYRPLWVVNAWGPPGERPCLGVAFYDRSEALAWAREVWPVVRGWSCS